MLSHDGHGFVLMFWTYFWCPEEGSLLFVDGKVFQCTHIVTTKLVSCFLIVWFYYGCQCFLYVNWRLRGQAEFCKQQDNFSFRLKLKDIFCVLQQMADECFDLLEKTYVEKSRTVAENADGVTDFSFLEQIITPVYNVVAAVRAWNHLINVHTNVKIRSLRSVRSLTTVFFSRGCKQQWRLLYWRKF